MGKSVIEQDMIMEVSFDDAQFMDVEFSADDDFDVEFTGIVAGDYSGSYEVTPTEETQTLATADKVLSGNITVHPIPSNYGLITWDGTKLTVS